MPVVNVLAKVGHKDRVFEEQAVQRTRDLFARHFGTEYPVNVSLIRNWKISQMLWIEGEDGETTAATLISNNTRGDFFRVNGLAVDTHHQRKGFATAIMDHVDTITPSGAVVEVAVDLDTESTEWLISWYTRRGFKEIGVFGAETRMHKRL